MFVAAEARLVLVQTAAEMLGALLDAEMVRVQCAEVLKVVVSGYGGAHADAENDMTQTSVSHCSESSTGRMVEGSKVPSCRRVESRFKWDFNEPFDTCFNYRSHPRIFCVK